MAEKEVRWGLAQETLCLEAASSQPQVSCKCLPMMWKIAKSSSCSEGRAPDPAWERSCSCALVTPLTTTKGDHSASKNKICIYVTPPPITFPSLSLPWFQGSTLQTWRDSSGSLVTSGTSVGVRPLCVTLVKPEARVGQEWGWRESYIHTTTL